MPRPHPRRRVAAGAAVAAVAGVVVLATLALLGPQGSAAREPAPRPAGGTPDLPRVPSDLDVDYQLGGRSRPDRGVGTVVRDRTEQPAGVALDVCYVNGFQTQPDQKRFWRQQHPDLLLRDDDGRLVEDEQWGEWLLDVSTEAKREALAELVGGWVDGCAADGYEAVEYDNLDSFTRSRGLLERDDALAYAGLLADRAHGAGLAAGQKNLAGWDGTSRGFDFAVTESCGRWRECDRYARHYGDQVLAVEYGDAAFRRTCRQQGDRWPVVRRDLALRPGGVHRYC